MWNDTNIPLAYLITFQSYGTWLHGDQRGSSDRFHNQYNSPCVPPDKARLVYSRRQLSREIVTLSAEQPKSTEEAIYEVCAFRKWGLRAPNVRTNHVHAVVSNGVTTPGRALNDFKAYTTRGMWKDGCWHSDRSPWADKGSKRYLWNERSVQLAVDYVLNGQGDALPNFD